MPKLPWFLLICLLPVMPLCAAGDDSPGLCPDGGRCVMGWNLKAMVYVDLKDIRAALDIWVVEVGRRNGLRMESRIYNDVRDVLADLKAGKVDMVTGTMLDYLYLAERTDIEVAFVGTSNGRKAEVFRLLVRADADIKDLADLRGKRLVVRKGEELGLLYVDVLLLRKGLGTCRSLFETVTEKQRPSQAVLSVFFGQADACIVAEGVVETMAAMNPQVGERLRAMASSPDLVDRVSFFRKAYDARAKDLLLRQASRLKETPGGRQLLLLFRGDGVARLRESELSPVRALLDEYKRLRGREWRAAEQ